MTDSDPPVIEQAPKSSRRVTLSTLITVTLLSSVASGVLGFFLAQRHGTSGSAGQGVSSGAEKYQCPMHPTIIQDHPGECPICGMKLVKVPNSPSASSDAKAASAGERRVLFYRSPMDPKQTSPTARKDEMGMDYVPVYADEMANDKPSVPGLSAVEIDPNRQQLIGLTTVEAKMAKIGGSWRTVGRVVVDETRVHHANVKISGFVEHIYVDFIGKQVYRGTPLFSMYSPDLLAAQDEFLLALKNRGILGASSASPLAQNDTLVNATRRKLMLWDVSEKTLDHIAQTGETLKTITFYSPANGVITKKDVVHGMKLDAGAMPYEIVDLSSVWVVADVYESELRFVKEGMLASLTLNAFPNREFNGKAAFIDPMLDPMTRTVKVRLSFPNPAKELKPEMFGEVVLKGTPHEALTIPADAVIDSGTTHVVFVAVGSGKFEPRLVDVVKSNGDLVEVTSGLTVGERVVTRANFLIDSESRLKASLSALTDDAKLTQPESARVLPATQASATASALGAPVSAPTVAPRRKATTAPATPAATAHDMNSMTTGHDAHEHHGAESP